MPSSAIAELTSYLSSRETSLEWPALAGEPCIADQLIELPLNIKPQLTYFEGHFPSQPVLPGVVQIHWAAELSKLIFKLDGFSTLQGLKFNSMILPDTLVTLALTFNQEKNHVKFKYFMDQQRFSLGTIIFSGMTS